MKWNTGNIAAQSEQLKKRVYNVDVEILEKYEIQTHYYQYLRNAEIESIAISRQFTVVGGEHFFLYRKFGKSLVSCELSVV